MIRNFETEVCLWLHAPTSFTWHWIWSFDLVVFTVCIKRKSVWACNTCRYSCFRELINNYWMRLSMISWIIKTKVCVICRSRRLRQITQTQGFDNSWYHAKTEFNNCFIIHFAHNSSSETETKCSAILFLGEHSKGLVTRQTLNLTW